MKPAVRRRSILLASIGTSPVVLTNAVWALAHGEKPVVPDEIVVFITKNGKTLLKKELFDDGVWADMLKRALPAKESTSMESCYLARRLFAPYQMRGATRLKICERVTTISVRRTSCSANCANTPRTTGRSCTFPSPLYKAIDALNKRYGKGKVFFARHAYARFGSLESRALLAWRLRRGSGREVVEDEAQQALQMPHHPLGRVDDGEMIAF